MLLFAERRRHLSPCLARTSSRNIGRIVRDLRLGHGFAQSWFISLLSLESNWLGDPSQTCPETTNRRYNSSPPYQFPMKTRCPRCKQGWVIRTQIIATNETLSVCEECEASWEDGKEVTFETFLDMSTVLKSKKLSGTWSDLRVYEE